MRVIYKYVFDDSDYMEILAHVERFLKADIQNGKMVVWAEVDPGVVPTHYALYIMPTGARLPASFRYIDTVPELDGQLIWHIYYENLDLYGDW